MKLMLKKQRFYESIPDPDKFETFFEAPVQCGELAQFNGDVFVVCQSMGDYGLLQKIHFNSDVPIIDGEDYLVCPVCNYRHGDSWELSDEDDEYYCERCNAKLSYTSEVTRTFSAKVIEIPKIYEVENGLK